MAKKQITADDVSAVMRAMGSKGARAGHAKLTPAERKTRASALATARWAKRKAVPVVDSTEVTADQK